MAAYIIMNCVVCYEKIETCDNRSKLLYSVTSSVSALKPSRGANSVIT